MSVNEGPMAIADAFLRATLQPAADVRGIFRKVGWAGWCRHIQ